MSKLLTSYTIGSLKLKNRMVMSPMTRCRAGEGGVPTSMNANYYQQRASAGLIVAEGTQISPQGVGYPATMVKGKRRERRKDERPAEILQAAVDEFAEKGFANAKIQSIATRAGVAKGTVYLYYTTKE